MISNSIKKRILYANYNGYPSADTGGPNNVINTLLNSEISNIYNTSYLSCDIKYNSYQKKHTSANQLNLLKKRITRDLYKKSKIYREIFSSKYWLKRHYKENDKYFEKALNIVDYDILHLHHTQVLQERTRIIKPLILTIHTKGSFIQDQEYIISKLLNSDDLKTKELNSFYLADIVVFPSESSKLMFLNYYRNIKLNNSKIRIIHNCVDIQNLNNVKTDKNIFSKLIIPNDIEYKLLSVANHIPQKKINILLEIVHHLKYTFGKKVLLLNVGFGEETENLNKIAKDLKVEKEFYNIKSMNHQGIINLMKVFDYYISVSENVVFDLVIIEALASGITTFASNDGGNKEIIIDGVNGYFIDTNSSLDASKIIIKSKKLKIENYLSTIEKFDKKIFINKYMNLYKEVLQ